MGGGRDFVGRGCGEARAFLVSGGLLSEANIRYQDYEYIHLKYVTRGTTRILKVIDTVEIEESIV